MTDKPQYPCRENFRQLSIYVTKETLLRLDLINRQEERSMNNLINRFIKVSIENYWREKGQPEPLLPTADRDTTEPAPEPE